MAKKCTNCKKPSISCGDSLFAPCVYWEVPEELQEIAAGVDSDDTAECVNLDFALTDIYTRIENLTELTDFSEFESDCLTIDGDKTLQTVITALDVKLCEVAEAVEGLTLCGLLDTDVTSCGLNYSCFTTDECDNVIVITTLKSLIQVLIDKVCALEAA